MVLICENNTLKLILQFWIYETFDTLENWLDRMSLSARPHMLRWRTRDILGWDDIETMFNGDTVSNS